MLAKLSIFVLLIAGLALSVPYDDGNVKAVCDGLGIDDNTGCACDEALKCDETSGEVVGIDFDCEPSPLADKKLTLSPKINEITTLESIKIVNCDIEGKLDIDIGTGKLENLVDVDFSGNKFTGGVPDLPLRDSDTQDLKVNGNCFTSCSDREDISQEDNPFEVTEECKTDPVTIVVAEKCLDIIMSVDGGFKHNDGGDTVESSKTFTLTEPLDIWMKTDIKNDVTFAYGMTTLFNNKGDAKEGLIKVSKLKMTLAEADLEKFRASAEKGEDDKEPVFKETFVVFKSTEEGVISNIEHVATGLELTEKESIKVSISHKDKTAYEVELVYSSASQIAFLFAIIVALSAQLFM